MTIRDPEQVLLAIKKDHPHLSSFINANKNVKWLQWEEFLSKGDKSDFTNLEHIFDNKNANNALEKLHISLVEWNYIYKHYAAVVNLIIADADDLREGIILLLTWSREIGLFKKSIKDIPINNQSTLVIDLWKDGLFLQLMLVLCREETYRSLLLADDMSALREFSLIKHKDPKMFFTLLHLISEKTPLSEEALQNQLQENLTRSPTFKQLIDILNK